MARSLRRSGRVQKSDPRQVQHVDRKAGWRRGAHHHADRATLHSPHPLAARVFSVDLPSLRQVAPKVLSERQQRFVDQLCVEHRFISLPSTMDEAPVIGTLERLPVVQVEEVPSKRPVASVTDAAAPLADLQPGP